MVGERGGKTEDFGEQLRKEVAFALYSGRISSDPSEGNLSAFQQLVYYLFRPKDKSELKDICEEIERLADIEDIAPRNYQYDSRDIGLVIRRISLSFRDGFITDDPVSEYTDCTPLEEIIKFETGLEDPKEIDKLRKEINSEACCLRGGFYLPDEACANRLNECRSIWPSRG
jgi:hypothetical protein